jgi:hypothetical protein
LSKRLDERQLAHFPWWVSLATFRPWRRHIRNSNLHSNCCRAYQIATPNVVEQSLVVAPRSVAKDSRARVQRHETRAPTLQVSSLYDYEYFPILQNLMHYQE